MVRLNCVLHVVYFERVTFFVKFYVILVMYFILFYHYIVRIIDD